jgi:hypothetical protein
MATTTDVYMQTMDEGVRSTVTSIHDEPMGTGTTGQRPAGTGPAKSPSGEGSQRRGAAPAPTSNRKEPAPARPVRGKVLQFATKMLPSQ